MKVAGVVLLFLLVIAVPGLVMARNRPFPQFTMSGQPPLLTNDKPPQGFPLSFSLKECTKHPVIPNAQVICGYSGCSVKCDEEYKMASGLGRTTLQCDHSSGKLFFDGKPWQPENVSCLPSYGVSGCLNGGTRIDPQHCSCPTNYTGQRCETHPQTTPLASPDLTLHPDTCPDPAFPVLNAEVTRSGQQLVVRCKNGFVFRIGGTLAFVQCRDGGWDYPKGVFSLAGALVCEEKKCNPPCLNGGECLPGGGCDCPYKYWGATCRNLRCAFPDPSSLSHASMGGVSSRMKIQCHPGYRMITSRRTQTIFCRNGSWFIPRRGLLADNDVKCYAPDEMPPVQQ